MKDFLELHDKETDPKNIAYFPAYHPFYVGGSDVDQAIWKGQVGRTSSLVTRSCRKLYKEYFLSPRAHLSPALYLVEARTYNVASQISRYTNTVTIKL